MAKKKVVIEIEAYLKTDFQRQLGQRTLFELIKSWGQFISSTHSKNSVAIKINGNDIDDLDWFEF